MKSAMLQWLFACLIVFVSGQSHGKVTGTIQGIVVNGSRGGVPIADAEIHLRANVDGVFEPVGNANTDISGNFSLQGLPIDSRIIYLPGANYHGVHYPGQRVRIDSANKIANVKIIVYDAVRSTSPLGAKRHNISVEKSVGLLKISESILISNPSHTTYVGESQSDAVPVTLRLSIPPNFDRVTFDSEFYGRRFRIIDHQLVTDMPWPPGDRELKFTYRVPIGQSGGLFRRPLDLPSENLCVRVQPQDEQLSCNLSRAALVDGHMAFMGNDEQFPIGYTINLQIGNLPIPWMLYGRWAALATVVSLVLGTLVVMRRRSGRSEDLGESTLSKGTGIRRKRSDRPQAKIAHHLIRADRMNA
jgi:hypothetical protein